MQLATTAALGWSVVFVLAPPSIAQITTRTSVSSSNAQGNGASYSSGISDDGQYVSFGSIASNLVPGDTNTSYDVFVRELASGTTTLVSKDSSGVQGNSTSYGGGMSADGRYVVFSSSSTNLVPGDTNTSEDVFRHDRLLGITIRVSVDSSGVEADGSSDFSEISRDGNVVVFRSQATNLAPGVVFGSQHVYARDILAGTTELLSQSTAGVIGNNQSIGAIPDEDGSKVAFASDASNLVPGDTNADRDIFLRDRVAGTTTRISVSTAGTQASAGSERAAISADGSLIAFESLAGNLVPGDTNTDPDVFLRDVPNGTTTRISLDSSGGQGNNSSFLSSLTPDGRFLSFSSWATNLVAGDTNAWVDGFVRDLATGVTERVTVSTAGAQGNHYSWAGALTPNGRFVTITSESTTLVSGDTNAVADAFLRDRGVSGFTILCEPGFAGVAGCPCGNPPSGAGRGCNNSAATGGATLSAAGVPSLSSDTLVFTTGSERATALSIVLQGDASIAAGTIYGQGIRCVGGALKRLYKKSASGGSITAPNFGDGDPTVSARSAAAGDTILPGQSRWYLVYYRDPTVLGGCPTGSTFNATTSGRVGWLP